MKKIILSILIALSLSNVVFAAGEATVPNGGTGWGSFISGAVIFGGSRFQLATSSSLTFSTSTNVLATPNASTTQLTTTNLFLTGISNGCLQVTSLLVTSTGSACGSGSGGTSNWTRFNNSGIYPATSTDQVVIGGTSTTTPAALEVKSLTASGGSLYVNGSTTLQNFTGLNATTSNATSTNFFATTASTTQEYSSLGISIGTSTAPNKSINIQKDDGTPFLSVGRGTISGWLQQSFSSSIYTTISNGGFMVFGDTLQDGVGKILQFAFPHQNQSSGGQSCLIRGVSGFGFNSIILGGGSSACKANEYFYVYNSGGTGSTTATGVQALQIDPLGQAIFGPGSTNTGYKLTVVGDTLLFGTTTASRFTATSTTLASTFPIITNTDITSTRSTTTNATTTNLFSILASTTNLYVGNGIAIGTTSTPFGSIVLQKNDGTTAYQMSRGVGTYSESMFANTPTFVSNGGSFGFGTDLTDSVDKITRLRFWGYNTASGIPNCGITNDSRAASNLILFGGVSTTCYGPTEYRYYISSSTNSTYQEGALTLNNTGLAIGNISPSERLTVNGSTTVASRVTASAFTATSSTATSSIPRIENTVFYMNNDFITDFTGSGLEIVGGALTVTSSSGSWSTTSADYWKTQNNFFSTTSSDYWLTQNQGLAWSTTSANNYINASTTIPTTYRANTWTANNTFNGGLTIDALNGPLQANAGVVSATTSIGVPYGGLGLTSAPAYGQIPVGNSAGGYTLTATSSLGISSASSTLLSDTNTWSALNTFAQTITTRATTTNATSTSLFTTTASTSNLYASQALIGTSTALSVDQLVSTGDVDTYSLTLSNSAGAGFNPWRISATGAGWSAGDGKLVIVPPSSTLSAAALFTLVDGSTGRVGIGTTSPYAKLAVVGQTVSEYFTATSTTASSTLPKVETTFLKVDGDTFNDLTGSGLVNEGGVLTLDTSAVGLWATTSDSYAFDTRLAATTTLNNITTLGALSLPITQTTGTLSVARGGTGQTSFGQGWLNSDGSTITSSTSPTVNYITATSTTDTSRFAGSLQVNGGTLFVDAPNNLVGIGTTTPVTALTVANDGNRNQLTLVNTMGATNQKMWSLGTSRGSLFMNTMNDAYATTTRIAIDSEGNVGIGSTTPFAKLSVDTSSTTATMPSFIIGSSTKTDFIVNGVTGNIGIGTTTLNRAKLSIAGNEPTPTVVVAGGLSGVDLFRFYRPSALGGTGQGLALIVSGNNAQFSFRTSMDAASSGTTRNTFMYDTAGNGLVISTSTSAGLVTGLEAFYLKNSTGNIGLSGTTTPWGSVSINPTIYTPAGQPTFVVGSSTKTDFIITQGGEVGVGTTSPWRKLSVVGSMAVNGLTTAAGTPSSVCINATTKEITENAALTCTVSDRDQKNIQGALQLDGVDAFMKLQPKVFAYKDFPDRARWGFIAQELQAVDPKLGDAYRDGEARSIDEPALIALTVDTVQKLVAYTASLGDGLVQKTRRSAEENWQWIVIGLLALGLGYQQYQINKLKK